MKNIIFFMLSLAICLNANAQTEPIINKTKTEKGNITQKPLTLQQKPGKNISVPQFPDLKFSALNVTATPTTSGGIITYTVNISYTVKNDGNAAVLTDEVTLQGFLSDESWITRTNKDLTMTGFLKAAGGQILSSVPNRGETLAPGASKQISYSIYNIQLGTDPKPIFIINIRTGANIKESDSGNNMAYVTILI